MTLIALADANNFYASVQKIFRPDLANKPVIVLSNNDGCVIARSREVKALGIKMGTPLFKIRDVIRQQGIEIFSSNFPLYADISRRVMEILTEECPNETEIYSIDECFLNLEGLSEDLVCYGQRVRQKVLQCTGITVCIGISTSKTLAKLANHAAKIYPATQGVVNLTSPVRQRKLLSLLKVNEVWGVGHQLSRQLMEKGIVTALDLANANPSWVKQQFSILLERTVHELNGISCLPIDEVPSAKQQIVCSRSFAERITNLECMKQAVSNYIARAAEKLRQDKQKAGKVTIFIHTSRYAQGQNYYSNSGTAGFCVPTSDTREILALGMRLLEQLWREGYDYAKAGVMLSEFSVDGCEQFDLFHGGERRASDDLMKIIDHINATKGKGTIRFAGQGDANYLAGKQQNLSPAYTTRWEDLPEVS